MTGEESCVYYPQYCFHLSRTIDQWCPLRIVDIHDLHAQDAHKALGIFFLSNHPIVWVRIAGVIVAVDYYYGRFVYTIDDSSGKCIECALDAPSRPARDAAKQGETSDQTGNSDPTETILPGFAAPPASEYDVGMVVIIKGSVQIFRDQKQMKIHKIQVVRSTEEEVQFWNKIASFRQEFLVKPWELSSEELRKCRKEYLKDQHRQVQQKDKANARDAKVDLRQRDRGGNQRNVKTHRTKK
ncbi:uncharacterized protein B0I36DRAFT_145078 [Microdochium trichocladiopsis]|uniref:CST complex subunit Stn1 N-terminal domain-containing protein n=1 Tax=Microdochium trichocladiopsis TaxID=1682393 RepID=A0A9P8Y4R0_9PEZI|nr:uncharacterized protein B0I36DRAFT_145078 [Microdochium trichocladiopsis]KAH7027912.1 hypothetical protein B0I36DRAFT_145078 [Microdochium trichocladiopsis]